MGSNVTTNQETTIAMTALRSGRPLRHDESACLPLRSKHGQCRRCAQVCPAQALRVTPQAIELDDSCIGCGRCLPVCPTGALELPEVEALPSAPPIPDKQHAIRIECRMAASKTRPDVTVPCTGSISVGRLLQWAAQGLSIDVMDHGWCQGCVAYPGPTAGADDSADHPARATVETANLWLEACGATERVRIVNEPWPVAQRPTALPPADDPGPTLDRRSFFRHAVERPTGRHRAQPMGGDGRAAHTARTRHPSAERQRQYQALSSLAEQRQTSVPAEFFPALHVDARCCDARMCEALCPTTALSVLDDGAGASLRFDPVHCIGCGACVRACPEGALNLTPYGGDSAVQTLIRHELRTCTGCGDRYAPASDGSDGDLCVLCRKNHSFIDDARRQLFGVR